MSEAPHKIAFAGLRHGHIFDLYALACASPALEVVAACEEHAETRAEIRAKGTAAITHDRIEQMLDEVDCDIVATGTYFAGRGPVLIEALTRGKHVISDKPLCTKMADLDRIAALAHEKNLKVGCMLTMRDAAAFIGARNLIQAGRIGEVHAIAFGGQHPLLLGSRPGWYFEQGKHGGTITDIGIHAIDALPWVTGRQWAKINAARCWRALVPEDLHMQDAGQMMLEMDNGCGVLGDVSYFAPDRAGYTMPYYWRTTFWGRDGVIETSTTAKDIQVLGREDATVQVEPLPPAQRGGYLHSFLDDIAGKVPTNGLDTAAVLRSTRNVIRIQEAADRGEREVGFSS